MKKRNPRKRSSQSVNTIAVEPAKSPPIPFVCPDCQGPIWEVRKGKLMRYQCLVGHRYTLENLLAAHADEVEQALWVALRALEERVLLQRRLAEQTRGAVKSRQMFIARARENEHHARLLRQMLEKLVE